MFKDTDVLDMLVRNFGNLEVSSYINSLRPSNAKSHDLTNILGLGLES